MKRQRKERHTALDELRNRAESAVRSAPVRRAEPRELDLQRLVHELEVHQVELEMQNEELRSTQLELQQSRDRYYELYDLAPIGYVTLDRAGRIQDANLRACELLGEARARVVGRLLAAYARRPHGDALHQHLRDVLSSDTKHARELVLGARKTPVRIESVAFDDAAGERGCRSVLIDLSELRRAEEGQRAAEARSAAILDTVTDAIVSSDAEGRIESFNRAAERLFGYSEAEVLGKNVQMLVAGGRPWTETAGHEAVGLRKDGSTFPLELGIGRWSEHGEPKLAVIVRDVTERKQREAELRESEARFRQIAENIHDAFIVHDRAGGHVVYASPAFEPIWGRPVSDLERSPSAWVDWIEPEDRERVVGAYQAFLGGAPLDLEFRIRQPNGELRWVRSRMFPIVEDDGSVQRDVAVVQDITAQRDLEEELRQAQKMEAVGALASGVAHDFNNVLQAVLGCLNVARDESVSPERAREYLDRAADAVRGGGELSGQLMAFARKQSVRPRAIAVDDVVRRSTSLLERLVTEQIALDVQTRAPDAAIVADPVQIEQLLLNLAGNARDAMPEGGTLSIRTDTIVADPPDGRRHLRLVVEDTGVGMDAATRARIFEPFFTTKELGKGTGIGLATVFATTQQLGGTVDVESEPGKGTRFIFLFRCSEQSPEAPAEELAAATRLAGSVLLVEDEPLVRMTVRHYLEQLGLEVIEAESPAQALALCETRDRTLDYLVSDFVLPGMNGSRLAALLAQRYPSLRVLFMSANPELLADEVSTFGRARVLAKPFDKEELASALAALSQRQTRPRSERTILIVEDEPIALMALRDLLKDSGYGVIAVPLPSQALAAAREGAHVDLLLTDVRLPEMDGAALAAELRRSIPDLRVVFMSGMPAAPQTAEPFVRKPVAFSVLLGVVDRALGSA